MSKADHGRVAELYRAGLALDVIGRRTGIGPSQVAVIVRKAGLKRRQFATNGHRGKLDFTKASAIRSQYMMHEISMKRLGAIYGVSTVAIWKVLNWVTYA